MIQKRRGPPSRSISRQNRGDIYFLRSISDKNVDSKNMTLGHAILNYGRPAGHHMDVQLAMRSSIMEAWVSTGVCLLFKKNKDWIAIPVQGAGGYIYIYIYCSMYIYIYIYIYIWLFFVAFETYQFFKEYIGRHIGKIKEYIGICIYVYRKVNAYTWIYLEKNIVVYKSPVLGGSVPSCMQQIRRICIKLRG